MAFAAELERRKAAHSGRRFVAVEQPCGETELAEIVIIVVPSSTSSASGSGSLAAAAAASAAPGVEAGEAAAGKAEEVAAVAAATTTEDTAAAVSPLRKRLKGKALEMDEDYVRGCDVAFSSAVAGVGSEAAEGADGDGPGGDRTGDVEVWEVGEGSNRGGAGRSSGGRDSGGDEDDDSRGDAVGSASPPSSSTRVSPRSFFPLSPRRVNASVEE